MVIPCYDDGTLLEEAMESIRESEPIEVVVVDDGSTDSETIRCLSRLEQRGTKILRQPNSGPAAARTTGMQATSGRLVFPLDADDRLLPGALAAMADLLDRTPSAGFVWGDYETFGDYVGRYRSPDSWLPWTLTYVNPYPISSLFRREVLERAGGWTGGVVDYEDWNLWLALVEQGAVGVRIPRIVYQRRLHGDARVAVHARRRHRDLYEQLQRRNAKLFASRKALREQEQPAVWKRMVYPVLFGPRKYLPFRVEAFLQRTMMRIGGGLPG